MSGNKPNLPPAARHRRREPDGLRTHDRNRAGLLAAALAACTVWTVTPVAVAAEPPSSEDTPCMFEYDLTVSPGMSLTASSGTYATNGETIPLTCTGSVDGKRVSGVGTWGETGRYGVSKPYACTDTSGDAVERSTLTIPTDSGPVHLVSDRTHITFGPLQGGGLIGGTFTGRRVHGSLTALPIEGNCVTAPITRLHVQVHVWITPQ